MNKNYIFLTVLALLIGFGILLMPEKKADKQIDPLLLLNAVDDPSRFLSPDVVTDRLVKKDPSMMLIDVRSTDQFNSFAIPGAINIPLDSILTESSAEILGNKDIDKVFYSNADLHADQAWILCKRTGYQAIYVLKGGVNLWFSNIVKTDKPAETEAVEVMELYQFRRAACQYFFGNNENGASTENNTGQKKVVVTTKKAPSASSGGGC
jgi:rhodanese-related sulfurtransferase